MEKTEQFQQQLAYLKQELASRDEEIHQLKVEAQGAAEAAQIARAELAQATAEQTARENAAVQAAIAQTQAAAARAAAKQGAIASNHDSEQIAPVESVLKTLQTPQIIRDLPCFDGNPIKLHSFIRAIDNIIPIIDKVRDSPIHAIWIQAIRAKIVGDADNVLELYGTSLSWYEIKSNLTTHYSDRRDECSLLRDLFGIQQTNNVEDFYGRISHIVSSLVNLLNITEKSAQVKAAKNLLYQQMGLKVFLSKLKDPLGPIIRAQTPSTLKEALRMCIEENNYHYVKPMVQPPPPPVPFKPPRVIPAFPIQNQKPYPAFPPIQNRYPFPQLPQPHPGQSCNPFQNNYPRPQPFQFKPFPFKPTPNPFNFQKPQNTFQSPNNLFGNKNVFAPKFTPQPKPTPMDIDPSMRSRRINYMNRPHYQIEECPSEEMYYAQQFYPDYDYTMYNEQFNYEQTEQQPQQADHVTNDAAEVASEPSAVNTDETDDLNFQTVALAPQQT